MEEAAAEAEAVAAMQAPDRWARLTGVRPVEEAEEDAFPTQEQVAALTLKSPSNFKGPY